jgi:hypothetical protein
MIKMSYVLQFWFDPLSRAAPESMSRKILEPGSQKQPLHHEKSTMVPLSHILAKIQARVVPPMPLFLIAIVHSHVPICVGDRQRFRIEKVARMGGCLFAQQTQPL